MGIFQAIKAALTGQRASDTSIVSGEPAAPSAPVPAPVVLVPRKVLFLESDPSARETLRACAAELGPAWLAQIVTSGMAGLQAIAAERFDAVAPALELEDMPGTDFLIKAAEVAPDTVGFLQASGEERVSLLKQGGLPPHFLPHPVVTDELRQGLERAFQLTRWYAGPAIRKLLARMHNLPAVPSLYARVMRELRSDDPSIEAVGKLIAQDPALTAKMLQMVNSPVFALGRPISEAVDAVTFLGAERTKALILMASLSLHGSLTPCEGFSQESFWQHSLTTATMGRLLALKELKDATMADTCFTAGLLHDIGKLLFASNLPQEYSTVVADAKARGISLHDAELHAFGVTHGQLGASLLGTWGLPMTVLEAIAWHQHPAAKDSRGFSGVTVVHAANVLEYEKRGVDEGGYAPRFEEAYLEELGLTRQLNHWRTLCGCPQRSTATAAPIVAHTRAA